MIRVGGKQLEGTLSRELCTLCLNLKMDEVENSLEIRSPRTVKRYK